MKTGLVWFRNNLRIEDNPALNAALQENDKVILLYIYDKSLFENKYIGIDRIGGHRIKFLFETVEDLYQNLQNQDLYLHIAYADTAEYMNSLVKEHAITSIYTQKAYGTEEESLENEVASLCELKTYESATLFSTTSLGFPLEKLPFVFTDFRKRIEKTTTVEPPVSFIRGKAESIELPDTYYLHLFSPKMLQAHKNAAYPYSGGETMANLLLNEYI